MRWKRHFVSDSGMPSWALGSDLYFRKITGWQGACIRISWLKKTSQTSSVVLSQFVLAHESQLLNFQKRCKLVVKHGHY